MELVYVPDLKSGFYGFESRHSHQFCGISIMDNTVVFYTTNAGSIPTCRTSCWADSLMVKQPTHNRSSLSSILSQPTKMPRWTNWQSRLSQKEKCCEFESHSGYQICRWSQLDRHWIANPWKQVRFLSPTPVNLWFTKV